MEIVATGGPLGAEIRGLDASRELDAATRGRLKLALLEHLVLFIRDQDLSEQAQVDFSRHFGTPEPHVREQPEGRLREIFVVSNVSTNGKPLGALGNGELTFHSDLSYLPVPGSYSIVHALEVPKRGGDTQWANAYAAYDAMDDELKTRVLHLRALHRHGEASQNHDTPVFHPVVRTHPETRRRATYVSPQFTRAIEGLEREESDGLLERLLRHVTSARFVWTHKWKAGDLVIWDNRCTMHRREPFPPSARRILKRTQIFGDPPFLEP